MNIKLKLFRVLSRYYIARIARIATYIALSLTFVYLLGTLVLTHFFSPWWWLLCIPLAIVLIAFFVLRFILVSISRVIYPDTVTPTQSDEIKAFIDKITRLLEIKNINPAMLALSSIKDFALYRELRTLKEIIDDSRTLGSDFRKLNDQF